MLVSNLSEGRIELMPGVRGGEVPMKVGNVLLDDEFPEKREWSVFCSSDLHPLPTDRGI